MPTSTLDHTRPCYNIPRAIIGDQNATLLDLYDWNAARNTNCTLFRYVEDGVIKNVSWKDANDATHRAAMVFSQHLPTNSQGIGDRPVLAFFAICDSITYWCCIMGALRAGFTAFPVSPRNSSEALAHLLTRTKANVLFTNADVDTGIDDVTRRALHFMSECDTPLPSTHRLPVFEDLLAPRAQEDRTEWAAIAIRAWGIEDTMCIMHSSGSTSFPKPIPWTARKMMQWALTPTFGDIDFNGLTIACHACPMFHAMGAMHLGATAVGGYSTAFFKPCRPAIFPTAERVLDEAQATGSDIIFTVPAFLEKWAQDAAMLKRLKTFKAVIFGGAPLLSEAGNTLVSAGVSLYNIYGSTETGMMTPFVPATPRPEWQYISFSEQVRPVFVSQNDGTYELVAMSRRGWSPSVMNIVHDGCEGFATNDLFVPHPTKPDLWMLHGRSDDQVMLSTGEKTNPIPLERILTRDQHIRAAVIFGRSRPYGGVLIELVAGYQLDVHDAAEVEAFKDTIWPTVEQMNAFAPQHSRIFRDMIMFAIPSKPFTYTAKGTACRQAIIKEYEAEIADLYESYGQGTALGLDVSASTSWHEEDITSFVRSMIWTTLGREVSDTVDVFQSGCDSLQATWIYRRIYSALQIGRVRHRELHQNCLYNAPTIQLLSAHILSLIAEDRVPSQQTETQGQKLHRLLEHYTMDFPARRGLGVNILQHLLEDPSVGTVYAFNRLSSSLKAQRLSLVRYGLDLALLESPKIRFVCGELSKPNFGLEEALFSEIKSTVTHVIHNAWMVDFNHPVDSYLDLLSGLRALVDLCLTSTHRNAPHLLFASSVGVLQNSNLSNPAPEEPIIDAVGVGPATGYAESKWLGERIIAASCLPNAVSVRIGQLSGGQNGYWNEREWFPSLIKSAGSVGCLPLWDDNVSWLPLHTAALALTQMRSNVNADARHGILHLAHPHPVPWSRVIAPLAKGLEVPLVPYADWFARLEKTAMDHIQDTSEAPTLRILEFFRSALAHSSERSPGREAMGIVTMDISRAQGIAPALAVSELPELDEACAEQWLAAWQKSGFIRVHHASRMVNL